MTPLDITLFGLSVLCCGITMYFTWRAAELVDGLKASTRDLSLLRTRMDMFEHDFVDKFDKFANKTRMRERMREKREEEKSTDSNTGGEILVPV